MKQQREFIKQIEGDKPQVSSVFGMWCEKCKKTLPTTHVYEHNAKEVKVNGR